MWLKANPLGGLARKAKWITDNKDDLNHILLLDPDLFHAVPSLGENDREGCLHGRLYEAYNSMGHHALGLGDRIWPWGQRRQACETAKFPFLNANVVNSNPTSLSGIGGSSGG